MKEEDCDIMVCDAMVRKYLPAMRAEMVFRLVHYMGLSQSDAARMLGVTRAAISQYMNRKRGDSGITLSPEMDALINRWTMSVAGEEERVTLCDFCRCAMKKANRMRACGGLHAGRKTRGLPSSDEGSREEGQ